MGGPVITAQFAKNANGEPELAEGSEGQGQRHYKVVFNVTGAPADAYAATFELNPASYDPIRTVLPENNTFTLETTTHGNYDLNVKLRTKSSEMLLKDSIVQALLRGEQDNMTSPAVQSAISDISNN